MNINPYLTFDGQCEAAFKFYEQCLGAKIVAMIPVGDTPMKDQMPPEVKDKIAHACLAVSDKLLMGSDEICSEQKYEGVKGCSVSVHVDTPVEAERIFKDLSKNGTVTMVIQETFWATRFGSVIDQFGVPWMINCPKQGCQ